MNINVIYGAGAANNAAPSGFYSAVSYVVNYLDQLFTNPVTVNLNISYGALFDPSSGTYAPIDGNALGESYSPNLTSESYGAVRAALQGQHAPGSGTLPSTSPVPGTLYVNSAEAKALGLQGATTALDGSLGISASAAWDYTTATPAPGQYYLIGTLEHEITELMGRASNLDLGGAYAVIDLYRFSAANTHSFTSGGVGSTAYFSIDNGLNNLGSWNNSSANGDLSDWYPRGPAAGGNDAFNDYGSAGVVNAMSATDVELMSALGWTTQTNASISGSTTPSLTANNVVLLPGHGVAATSLVTLSNPVNDAISSYTFLAAADASGHFTFNGAVQQNGQAFTVAASDLSKLQYVGGSSSHTDMITIAAFDSTMASWLPSASASAITTAPFPLANNADLVEALYVGYFGRAADSAGFSYWNNQLASSAISLSAAAASFSVQPEAISNYTFLANPTASVADEANFVASVYQDLFNRSPDPSGLSYWQSYLSSHQGNAQAIGAFVLNVVSGAQGADATTISNKITVADYLTAKLNTTALNTSSTSLLHTALAGVTSDTSSILSAEATIHSTLASQSSAVEVVGVGDVAGGHYLL